MRINRVLPNDAPLIADLLGELLEAMSAPSASGHSILTVPLPQFERTLRFYGCPGFRIAGGRKIKLPP
jgi:hypothetical protein